uniref:BTB domain-containing protein n=1 Tax=Timema shepardi TaxID=629360 RepID=A0A7R9ASN2_TIMSH|nr:unnamed protein product [Timema shepardi]
MGIVKYPQVADTPKHKCTTDDKRCHAAHMRYTLKLIVGRNRMCTRTCFEGEWKTILEKYPLNIYPRFKPRSPHHRQSSLLRGSVIDHAATKVGDVIKLQLHLSLLKDEYVKLQNYCSDLERKYSLAIAKHGEVNENGFLSKLLQIVGGLFNQDQYSDIKVKLDGQLISAHRFVLSARSDSWGVTSLFHADLLDWSMLNPDVGRAVLKWVYTDEVDFFDGDKFTLDLMCTANEFKLDELVTKCEKVLIASANINNCISLYTTACQMGANFLKEHCSGLISAHWNDFTPADFSSMNSALLFDVLKSQTNFPLHSAIRLHRDDVVFLFLIAFNNEETEIALKEIF